MYSKDIKESCLARLYTHDLEGIEHVCDIRITEKRELIQQLSTHKFRILSDSPTQIGAVCKGGISKHPQKFTIQGNRTFDFNATCEVTTRHYVFTTSVDMYEQQSLVNLTLDLASIIMKPEETHDVKLQQLYKVLNDTRSTPHHQVPLKEYKAALLQYRSSEHYSKRKLALEISVVVIASLVLILVVAYYGKPLWNRVKTLVNKCKRKPKRRTTKDYEISPLRPSAPRIIPTTKNGARFTEKELRRAGALD